MRMRQIERTLAPRFRGRVGFRRMLKATTLRISVSGIRGKTGLTDLTARTLAARGLSVYAKQTGTVAVSVKDGRARLIERQPDKPAVLNETYREIKRHWPFDAMVLENQGITPYTMRVFNQLFCKPHYVLITNIRRDHMGDLARTLPRMTRAFARSVPRGATLVSGESDPELRQIMESTCRRRGVRFLDGAPPPGTVPGYETVTALDALLTDWMGEGLTRAEKNQRLIQLEETFRWRPSAMDGVQWFHGAEVNDVDSTQIILEHLRRQQEIPVTFIAYLRRDRADRTASFIPFLAQQLQVGVARQVILVGHGAKTVRRRLRQWKHAIHILPDTSDSLVDAASLVRNTCRGQAVMTIINAVPPWPRAMARILAGEKVPSGQQSMDAAILSALQPSRAGPPARPHEPPLGAEPEKVTA